MISTLENSYPKTGEGLTKESGSLLSVSRKEVAELLSQKLLSGKTAKEEICQDSKIEASRIFSEKEIIKEITDAVLNSKQASNAESAKGPGVLSRIRKFIGGLFGKEKPNTGIQLETLKVSRIIRDANKTIVALDAVSPDADGKGGETEIKFLIQGKHGQNQSSATTLMLTHYDNKGLPEHSNQIAEFKKDKWLHVA